MKYSRGVRTKKWSPFDGKLWQRDYYEDIGPADDGRPRWATIMVLRDGRKFWLPREDRLAGESFWVLLGAMPKRIRLMAIKQ
jgi:hypothetical protein